MINRKQAQQRILKFAKKYEGKSIEVSKLNNRDLYDLILTETYLGIDALLGYGADVNMILDRAIEKAEQHKRDKFIQYVAENGNSVTQII